MRHGRKTIKLQRRQDHRNSLLSNLVCSLIEHKQIKTTMVYLHVTHRSEENSRALVERLTSGLPR